MGFFWDGWGTVDHAQISTAPHEANCMSFISLGRQWSIGRACELTREQSEHLTFRGVHPLVSRANIESGTFARLVRDSLDYVTIALEGSATRFDKDIHIDAADIAPTATCQHVGRSQMNGGHLLRFFGIREEKQLQGRGKGWHIQLKNFSLLFLG